MRQDSISRQASDREESIALDWFLGLIRHIPTTLLSGLVD